MAETSLDLSASNPQPKKGILRKLLRIKPKPQKPKETYVVDFPRDEISSKSNDRSNVDIYGRKQEGMLGETVGITEELRQQHTAFLKTYLKGLSRVFENDESLLHLPGHEQDLKMWELLCTSNQPDTEKINRFLSHSDGILISTQIMDVEMSKRFAALRRIALLKPIGERGDRHEKSVATQEDIGPLRKRLNAMGEALDNKVWLAGGRSNMDKKLFGIPAIGKFIGNITWKDLSTFGALSSPAVGYVLASMVAVPGGLAAAIPGVFAAEALSGVVMPYLLRGGVKVDLRPNEEVFSMIKSDPREAKFMKLSTGLDVNRWNASPGNKFKKDTQYIHDNPSTDMEEEDLMKDAMSMYYTRFNTLVSLGEPRHRIDANSLQAAMTGTEFEKTGLNIHRRVREEYEQGGIPPQAWARAQKLYHASSKITAQMIEEYATAKPQIDPRNDAAKKLTDEKIIRFKEGGAKVTQRKAELGEKKKIVEIEKGVFEPKKENIEQYNAAYKILQDAKTSLGNEFPGILPTINDIDAEIVRQQRSIDSTAVVGSIKLRRLQVRQDIRTDALAAIALLPTVGPAAVTGKNRDNASVSIWKEKEEEHQGRVTELDEEEAAIRRKITRLQELKGTIGNAEESLNDEKDIAKNVEEVMVGLDREFTEIAGWNGTGGVALTQIDLLTQPVDELMKRINAIYAADNTKGWSPNRNNRQDVRERLLNAKMEAIVRQKETLDPAFTARDPDFVAIRGFNISENQLRVMSQDQIMDLVNKHHVATGGATGWAAAQNANPANITIVSNAIDQAKSRLNTRFEIIKQNLKDSTESIKDIEEEIENVKFDNEVNKLETTKTLMERQGAIYSNTKEFTSKSSASTLTEFTTPPAAGENYTEAEIALGAPRGYLDMMDLFFDYRNRPDREEYFKKVSGALPPHKLADRLAKSMNLGFGPHTINTVLGTMHIALTSSPAIMDYRDLHRHFRNVINENRDEAIAMAA